MQNKCKSIYDSWLVGELAKKYQESSWYNFILENARTCLKNTFSSKSPSLQVAQNKSGVAMLSAPNYA